LWPDVFHWMPVGGHKKRHTSLYPS
jgi:hypothetical protein